jgi:SAM-dependent methyltransferase
MNLSSSHATMDRPTSQPEQYLADLYTGLGSQRNDFRNANLNRWVATRVVGENVLDVGCGNGALLGLLSRQGKRAFGVEPNGALTRLAASRHPELTVLEQSGDGLHRFGRRFDTVTILDVLEHIEDDKAQLRRIFDVLEDRGRLVAVVPACPALYGKRDINNGHFRRYTRSELVAKLRRCGFRVRLVRHWNALGFLPYWFSERILRRELNTRLRTDHVPSPAGRLLVRLLHGWFRQVENRVSFGFGLSLLAVAEKPAAEEAPMARSA